MKRFLPFQGQPAAWSPCPRAPARSTLCCGTSTLALGNAGRLCTAAVMATGTGSPRGKSARAGAEGKGQTSQTPVRADRPATPSLAYDLYPQREPLHTGIREFLYINV